MKPVSLGEGVDTPIRRQRLADDPALVFITPTPPTLGALTERLRLRKRGGKLRPD
jgi:hypothetical protein